MIDKVAYIQAYLAAYEQHRLGLIGLRCRQLTASKFLELAEKLDLELEKRLADARAQAVKGSQPCQSK